MTGSSLHDLHIAGQSPATDWCGDSPTLDHVSAKAEHRVFPLNPRIADILGDHIQSLCPVDPARTRSLEDLKNGACVVCAGQQPGLFGGPLLSLYKALTAVRLCQEMRRRGIMAVPLFWNASEDHDLDEANRAVFPATEGSLEPRLFKLPVDSAPRRSLSHTAFDSRQMQEARDFLVAEGCDLNWLMGPEETWGSWMSRIILTLTEGTGLLVCEPSWFVSLATNFRSRILRQRRAIFSRVLERTNDMRLQGFPPPVRLDVHEETGLFADLDERRSKIKAMQDGSFSCGGRTLSEPSLQRLMEQHPEYFSQGVLIRPLWQQQLFPVVAQVVGPTELAYLAQVMPVFEFLHIPAPVFWPRQHVLLVDRQTQCASDIFQMEPHEALTQRGAFDQLEEPGFIRNFDRDLRVLLDSSPWNLAMDSESKHEIRRQWKQLRKTLKQKRKKQLKTALGARHALTGFLRPRNRRQERVMTPCSLKIPLGPGLAAGLLPHLDPCSFEEKVLYFRDGGIFHGKA